MEKISVISGIYNHRHLLPKVFAGWEAQTFKDFKVYFCDDGSSDGTDKWIKTQKPKFEFEYLRQEQKGMRLGKNLNQGIRKAKGKYTTFIMGDTVPYPDFLEKMIFHAKPNRVLCGVRENVTEGMEHINWDWRYKTRLPQLSREILGIQDNPWGRITGNGLWVPTGLLRKVGGWPEDYVGYSPEDNLLAVKLYVQEAQFFDVPSAKIKHIEHEIQPDNLQAGRDFQKQAKKLLDDYRAKYWPPTIALNFDDFTATSNNFYFLEKLRRNYPQLKVSVFLIPEAFSHDKMDSFLDHPDLVDDLRKSTDWLEFCPHGWNHPNLSEGGKPEFQDISYADTQKYMKLIEEFFTEIDLPYQKIFKAPQYQISKAALDCFLFHSWTVMLDGTGQIWPKKGKTIAYNWNITDRLPTRKVIVSYGHIQDIGNGMVECWESLLQMPPDSNFVFLSEL
jgi:glycosyltransferase involved in cell wall biosynthesis